MIIDGETIVKEAWEPVFDTARALHAKGITGSVVFLDGKTLKPRLTLTDIEKGAGLTVTEIPRLGLAKWKPYKGVV